MKYIASCSGGKDSLAMVLRILEENLPLHSVIFYDTEMEFDAIYRNIARLKTILRDREIPFIELSSKNHFLYNMFVRPVQYRNPDNRDYPIHYGYEWCGGKVRWGTSGKLSAIRNYYQEQYPNEEIIEYVGIAADEPERIGNNQAAGITKTYPLVEWGMTEKDCLNYCYDHGWDWKEGAVDLYDILDRVSCWCCANKNLKELKNIYRFLPDYWQRLRGIQSRVDSPMKGAGKSVFDLEVRFKEEIEKENEAKKRKE